MDQDSSHHALHPYMSVSWSPGSLPLSSWWPQPQLLHRFLQHPSCLSPVTSIYMERILLTSGPLSSLTYFAPSSVFHTTLPLTSTVIDGHSFPIMANLFLISFIHHVFREATSIFQVSPSLPLIPTVPQSPDFQSMTRILEVLSYCLFQPVFCCVPYNQSLDYTLSSHT